MATEQERDAKLAELKAEIAKAADRVLKKIDKIIAANPDLSDELEGVSEDVEAIRAIAPEEEAPPTT